MPEQEIGVITHYFGHIQVAGVRITDGTLRTGDRIHVVGHTSDFEQEVGTMQVDHADVDEVGPGAEIGLKVVDHAREHDKVYKVVD